MKFEFTKMNALGNDYILIDGFKYKGLVKDAQRLARKMSDRHFGAGGDGVIFILPASAAAKKNGADVRMRMFNADGSEAEMCGNGIRQLALFAYQNKIFRGADMCVETPAGLRRIALKKDKKGGIASISVNMGIPVLDPALVPAVATRGMDGYSLANIDVADRNFDFTLVSMGNPHAVTFTTGVREMDVERYGKPVENNLKVFPKRTNVEFIEVLSRKEILMRVWERGSGETLACGTGACASVVAAALNGLTERKVKVRLLGGDLMVEWKNNNEVIMTGNAERVYNGVADTSSF